MPARAAAQAAAPAASGDAALNALFEEIFQDRVKRNPELATVARARQGRQRASEVGARRPPLAAGPQGRPGARQGATSPRIKAVPPASLSDAARLNREVVIYQIETGLVAHEKFGIDSVQRPYPIFQQGGAYFSTPDFLNTRAHDRQCGRRRGLSVAPGPGRQVARQ